MYINPADEPTGDYRRLWFRAHDGFFESAPVVSTIRIIHVNDPPRLSQAEGTDRTTVFYENDAPVLIYGLADVVDPDSTRFPNITVTIIGVQDAATELITATGSFTVIGGMVSPQVYRFTYMYTPSLTLSDLRARLNNLQYSNTKDEPTPGLRYVTVSVQDDQGAESGVIYSNITVANINDNAPLFDRMNYRVCVPEGVRGYCLPVNISASDGDDQPALPPTNIMYSMTCANTTVSLGSASGDMLTGPLQGSAPLATGEGQIMPFICDIFMIDSTTAKVTTCNSSLCVVPRRVVRDLFFVNITASDGQLSSQAMLTIETRQVNNYPPVISNPSPIGVLEGPGSVGTISQITATDADPMAPNNAVTFQLGPTTNQSLFHLSENGTLTLLSPLNFEQQCVHAVEVIATDGAGADPDCFFGGAMTSTATIQVLVMNANEFDPVFQPPAPAGGYQIAIPEETLTNIFLFEARDADTIPSCQDASQTHLPLTFTLLSNPTGGFFLAQISDTQAMLNHNGQNGGLDRESGPSMFVLSVRVTDFGGRSSDTSLTVTLTDINDNTPVFAQLIYTGSVPEMTEAFVLRVMASDSDLGTNAMISYGLEGAPASIVINSTGHIYTSNTALDFENGPRMYEFNVTATDGGNPPRSSKVPVQVSILDINDQQAMLTAFGDQTFYVGQRPIHLLPTADIVDADSHIHPIQGLRVRINAPNLNQRTTRPCDCDVGPFGTCTNVSAINVLSTMTGDVTPVGDVATFDGTQTSTVSAASLPSLFIEGWIVSGCFRLEVNESSFGYILAIGDPSTIIYFGLQIEANQIVYTYQSEFGVRTTVNLASNVALNQGSWHSFAANINFRTVTLHIDGVLASSTDLTVRPLALPNAATLNVGCLGGVCFRGSVRRLILKAGVGNLLEYVTDFTGGAAPGATSGETVHSGNYARIEDDRFGYVFASDTTELTTVARFTIAPSSKGVLVSQGYDNLWRFGVIASSGGQIDVFFRTCVSGSIGQSRRFIPVPNVDIGDGQPHTLLVQVSQASTTVFLDNQPPVSLAHSPGAVPCFTTDGATVDANSFLVGAHARRIGAAFSPMTGTIHYLLIRPGIISPTESNCLMQGCGGCRCGGRCTNLPVCTSTSMEAECRFDFSKYAQCDISGAVDLITLSGVVSTCSNKDLTVTEGILPMAVSRDGGVLPSSLSTFTVLFWFRLNGTSGEVLVAPGVFSVRVTTTAIVLSLAYSTNGNVVYTPFTFSSGGADLSSHSLYQAVITVTGDRAVAYLNGQSLGEQVVPANRSVVPTGNWYIGSWPGSGNPSFAGVLRGLAVTHYTVSATQALCVESCGHFLTVAPPSPSLNIVDRSQGLLLSTIELHGHEMENEYGALLRTVRYYNLITSPRTVLPFTYEFNVEILDGPQTSNYGVDVTLRSANPPQLLAGGHQINHFVRLTMSRQEAPVVANTVQALLPTTLATSVYINVTIEQGCRQDDRVVLAGPVSQCFNYSQTSSGAIVRVESPACLLTTVLRLLR